MEEKKEMTFLEELNGLVDEYQAEKKAEHEKAMKERKENIDYYLMGQCRTYARCGHHRVRIDQEEVAAKTSVDITIEDIIVFAKEKNMDWNWNHSEGEKAVEIIWKDGEPKFYEEPTKELPLPEEESTDEPSAESFTEAVNKMVDGMAAKETADETIEKDLTGPLLKKRDLSAANIEERSSEDANNDGEDWAHRTVRMLKECADDMERTLNQVKMTSEH